ncbi:amidohydrolase family protein [Robertkochia sediminum]|uniref:amidohydrolase family protein n=1 Tax=Robertkochia sediminum TaxID=2785326 RepID=UPI0019347454|nr:amidohydrolase family protein [Robertkochia sediminum]MBL7473030.1 amidohydrolase family protein [Robertkochia sediminum]
MRKFLNILLKSVLTLLLILMVFAGVILVLDDRRTSYLEPEGHPEVEETSWLITHVNVIPMDRDTVLTDHSVLIKNGRIAQVAPDITTANYPVIDGENAYLMPGLTDMHVHVWDQYELGLYLANGVTTVRNLWGRPFHLKLKKQIGEGKLLSPQFFTSGPKLTGPEFIGDDNTNLHSPEEAREIVKKTYEQGYDLIKTYYGLPEAYFDAILEESQVYDLDIAAHTSNKVDYAYHFNPQIKTIEHAEDIVQQGLNYTLDTVKLKELVAGFAEAEGTSFCPTLIVYYNIYNMLTQEGILDSSAVGLMNPMIRKVDSKAQYDRWANTKRADPGITEKIKVQHEFHLMAVKALHDAGVNIVCGSDAGIGITAPGEAIHDELAFYREAGLSPYEVLRTATANPSQVHDFLRETGTVQQGKRADLLLLDENPLIHPETLQHARWVMVGGRKLNRDLLSEFEAKAMNRKNLFPSLLRYAGYLWEK